MTKRLVVAVCCASALLTYVPCAQGQESPLSVQKIMQDPKKWIGAWPSAPVWSEDGETVYFNWNPGGQFTSDSLFKVGRQGGKPIKVLAEERRPSIPRFTGWHHGEHVYDRTFSRKVYEDQGDLFLLDLKSGDLTRLTQTLERETGPRFTPDGSGVLFRRGSNLFRMDFETGSIAQVTDLRSGAAPAEKVPDAQDKFLQEQQSALFGVIRERERRRNEAEASRKREETAAGVPPVFYYGTSSIRSLQLDPAGRYVTFLLVDEPDSPEPTSVGTYVTESGHAGAMEARPKVGAPGAEMTLYVQDLQRDTTYKVDLLQLPGAYDVPAYLREQGVVVDSAKTARSIDVTGLYWRSDGRYAVVDLRATDNKDRWIARLDPETATLTVLDRQTDDAWIGGPGISTYGEESTVGWLPDGRTFFFQSERTGYSHLYTVDVETGEIQQLTSGTFEVFDPQVSKDGRYWYFTSSEDSPYERHFYRMPIRGGKRERLTSMEGHNQVALSPDGEMMAILYSYTNRPPEVYLQPVSGKAERITESPTSEWLSYEWHVPETISFEASDGVRVPAHVFRPEQPNGAAVLFVHGAGYLQNVHAWWSNYYREYMFHNLLTDLGYTVMNVDYRASEGYGRDWRTAIYRHMGGRDLQDYVDASRYLGETYGIDPERVFIYGGSYGGFITLMALFTEPEHFGGGAALRAVTDWAHYNHGYTSNILNTPVTDSLAYVRSSPIYFAEGLQDPLLIAHGMVDTNVHFQDVVRLVQRLIELGKEDWEMAVYPVEDHGFVEPASWTDEYRRILDYIERSVGPKRGYYPEREQQKERGVRSE